MSLLHRIMGGVESALLRHQSTGVAIVSALLVLLVLQIALRDSRVRRRRRQPLQARLPHRPSSALEPANRPLAPPAASRLAPSAGAPPSPSEALPTRGAPVRLRRPGESDDAYVWR